MSNNVSTISTGFDLKPKNMGEAMQLATMIANSQLAPKNFANKPEDTLVAMMMGNEVGLNPMQAIQNIAVINGRPCIWGDAMLALVQNHNSFGGIEETFEESTLTATCIVWRKNGTKHTQTFSQRDAEVAGLWGRNTWKQYPKRMLSMRARGFALRNQFADALLGLITREEAEDIPVKEAIQQASQAEDMKAIEAMPVYTDEQFKTNIGKWEDAIKAGKKSAKEIVSMVSSKYTLTDEQEANILDLGEAHENA